MKAKLSRFHIIIMMALSLLPFTGAKKAEAISHPYVADETYEITLYVRPYAGVGVSNSCYSSNAPGKFFTNGKQEITLTEKWYDNGSVMADNAKFIAGKKYTYEALLVSANEPGRPAVVLSTDKISVTDVVSNSAFKWSTTPEITLSQGGIELYKLKFKADFVAPPLELDDGNCIVDLSFGNTSFVEGAGIITFIGHAIMKDGSIKDLSDDIYLKSMFDLDKDGSPDVEGHNIGSGWTFARLSSSSIKDKITIRLSDDAIDVSKYNFENYFSSVTFIFYREITDTSVSSVPEQTYTGAEIKPSPAVKYNSDTLKAGTDYDISYKNNIDPGLATLTITGKGSYTGTKDVTFKIVKPETPNTVETITAGGCTFSIQDGAASVIAPEKKTVNKAVIPASIKVNGKKINVTSIAPGAFKGCKKLRAVTIGKNIKSIGKDAFSGCKNLKKITLKTAKLTKKTVGRNAFKGINRQAVVKSPKAVKAAYKKFLLKKGMKKTINFR